MEFYRDHGLGNDYLLIALARNDLTLNPDRIRLICDRHFGGRVRAVASGYFAGDLKQAVNGLAAGGAGCRR